MKRPTGKARLRGQYGLISMARALRVAASTSSGPTGPD
jgi:hypothetical protein